MNKELIRDVLRYRSLGLSVIPVGTDKRPLLKSWREFQTRIASEEEIKRWFAELNPDGVAIITGKISGVAVLDIEKDADTSGLQLPPTPCVKTGGGGWHYYFRYPQDKNLPNSIRFKPNMDFKGEAGYVLAPPSLHSSGKHYEWRIEFDNESLADIPDWILKSVNGMKSNNWNMILEGVPEGERNKTAASLAGKVLSYLRPWNLRNNPPLPDKELTSVIGSIVNRELKKDKAPLSVSDILSMELPEETFLVEGLIPQGSLTVLSGYPGCGKSWIILHLAQNIAQGTPVFGEFETSKGSVLIIDEEAGIGEFQRRMKLMNFSQDLPIYLFSQEMFKVDTDKDLGYLLNLVKEQNIKLVALDPFVAFHSKRENNAEEIQKIMEALQQFTLVGATVLFTHHHRKELGWGRKDASQSLRGSSVMFGRVDSHLAIEKKEESPESLSLVITQEKLRRGKKGSPFQVRIEENEDGHIFLEHCGEYQEKKKKIEEAKELILAILEEESEIDRNGIIERIGNEVGSRAIGEALKALEAEEEIYVDTGERNKKVYSKTAFSEEEKHEEKESQPVLQLGSSI